MTRTDADADVVVLGLGVHGAAAAWELAVRGVRVLGLDRFPEGHKRGSSHGRTRMIRRAYPNPVWNDFVSRAYAGWERWESRVGSTLVHPASGLYAHPERNALQGPGCRTVTDSEARRLMPSLRVPAGHHIVHDPAAGVVEAEQALTSAHAGARANGAVLDFEEEVRRWQIDGDGVVVHTARRVVRARRLVLASGAWVGQQLPKLTDLFEVWRILTVTLWPGQTAAESPALGPFAIDRPEGLLFGIPDLAGNGFKVGVDAGEVLDPDVRPAPPTDDEVQNLLDLMRFYVPSIEARAGDVAEAVACLYTMTADRRFVLGPLPSTPQVIVAAACSGHAFKFGPAVGEAVADWCTGIARPDLDFVGVGRRVSDQSPVPQTSPGETRDSR